jgi:hypothetical protein
MKYFSNCETLNDVKQQYKTLAKQFHPDISKADTTAIMQEINKEYAFVVAKLAKGENLTAEQIDAEILNAEQYRNAVNAIMNLEGINVELCGGWLWVSGNTYQHKAVLKEHGFYFASVKKMWYFRSPDYATSCKRSHSMEYIRTKYGSQVLTGSYSNKFLA